MGLSSAFVAYFAVCLVGLLMYVGSAIGFEELMVSAKVIDSAGSKIPKPPPQSPPANQPPKAPAKSRPPKTSRPPEVKTP